jgi:hypothetical protein
MKYTQAAPGQGGFSAQVALSNAPTFAARGERVNQEESKG